MDPNLRYLGIGAAVRAFGFSLLGPFLALYLRNIWGISYVELAVLFFLLGIIPIPFSIGGGLLTDRIGRRRLFLLTLAGEAVFTGLLAWAMWVSVLWLGILAAVFLSIVSSIGGPALSAYVADFAVGSDRTKGYTWWRVGMNAGFAAGVASGGFLIPVLGFPLTAGASAVILVGGVILVLLLLEPSPYDLKLAEGTALAKATEVGLPKPGLWFHRSHSTHKGPSLRKSLGVMMKDRTFMGVCFAMALIIVTVGQWNVTFSLFVNNKMGISYELLGLGLSLNGIVVVVGQTATTNAVLGSRLTTIAIGGTLLYVVAYLAMGAATLFAFFPVVVFFVAVGVLTLGENLSAITSSTLPSNMAPPSELGSYNGAAGASWTVGGLVAVLVGGIALQVIPNPLLFWGVLVLPAFPAMWLLHRTSRAIPKNVDRA
jgi:MFS family permease